MKAEPVLIIEDEHALGAALAMLVRRIGHLPTTAATAAAGMHELSRGEFGAVILDIGLPDKSGLELLREIRATTPLLPVLVITAHATLDHAIGSQRSGATAYLVKPLDMRQVEETLGTLLSSRVPLRPAATQAPRTATLIGAASCMRDAFIGIARACAAEVPVLIRGAGGTGKTLAASVIHAHSNRAAQGMEAIDCAGLRDTRAIESATCGTLVLDDITSLSGPLQTWLASQLCGPVAGPRVLATTSRDPAEAMMTGALREELFYALNTLCIPLPPLRERSGDIPALADHFIGLRDPSSVTRFTTAALDALQAYDWPGNVRELRHVVECAMELASGGPVYPSHLPPQIAGGATSASPAPAELRIAVARWLEDRLQPADETAAAYDTLLDEIERMILSHLLDRHGRRPTRVAAAHRIHRATLRQKLRRVGLAGDES